MGYRMKPWSEEMPPQLQYIADPSIPAQYRALGEEAYARSQQTEQMRNQMASETLAIKRQGDAALGEGIKEGVVAYKQGKERNADRQLKNAQFEREGRLSEEQLAASKQQRELAAQEEQRRAERNPIEMESLKAQSAGIAADTKGKVQTQAFRDAVSNAPDANGRTNAQYEADKDIEIKGYNAQTARQQLSVQQAQLKNEEQRLAQAKEMAPFERQQLQANIEASRASVSASKRQIAEMDRAQATKDATSILQAEMSNVGGDPGLKAQRLEGVKAQLAKSGASPAVIAEAINNANASEAQKAFMAKQMDMMDPQKQAAVSVLVKGYQDATLYKQTLANLQSSYEEYKASSNLPDTKGKAAKEKFQQALRDVGEESLAADLDSSVGDASDFVPGFLGGNKTSAFGREGRMNEAMKTVQKRFADQMGVLATQDPRFGQYAKDIATTRVGDKTPQEVAAGFVPLQQGMPQQSTVGQPQQSINVNALQGLPGVKIRPQVGNK